MLTQKFISSFLAPRFQSYEQLHDMVFFFSVAFCLVCFSPVMHIWTSLFCIDLGPAAGLLKIFDFWGPRAGLNWGWFYFIIVVFFLFFSFVLFRWCPPHHPSSILQARIEPLLPFFASSCAAWTFGGWKIFKVSPPHQVCVLFIYLFFFSCAIWLLKKHPPPSFSIQRREMNGNKIFSCHHPFFGLVQATPFCLKKVVCERMTPPSPLPSVTPTPRSRPPSPLHPDSPTFFLYAFLHIHVCLNADGIKRLLLPQSISVFLFYLLLQVEGICGMHTVLDCTAAL